MSEASGARTGCATGDSESRLESQPAPESLAGDTEPDDATDEALEGAPGDRDRVLAQEGDDAPADSCPGDLPPTEEAGESGAGLLSVLPGAESAAAATATEAAGSTAELRDAACAGSLMARSRRLHVDEIDERRERGRCRCG
jgi:hypothetical protein